MLLRGNSWSVPHIGKLDVKRLIVHSHPGELAIHLMPSGVRGDVGYLWRIGQRRSYIVTSGTNQPGTPFWIGQFDNTGFYRGLNTPEWMGFSGALFGR
jgi:hypothetical protein